MNEPDSQLQEALHSSGYSLTTARRAVFTALRGNDPQTMRELVIRCPDIDRASVYRTVALFENFGIVQRLQIGWKYKLELSDQYAPHHHHASCQNCSKIIALPEDTVLEKRLLELAKAHNFQPQDHQLEIRGLCASCHN
ncbi:MAG TPA: transcriptional repressor [Candidatus Saccharimonadales bacterium]|nr:transcriptional repressor [Candidatus Saccharimonadales bacterium]